jgi:hypothetical protein
VENPQNRAHRSLNHRLNSLQVIRQTLEASLIDMALSEIIRFVLPSHRTSDFFKLRQHLSLYGGVKYQYFGNLLAPSAAALPIKKDEKCWVIRTFHNSEHSMPPSR